MTDSSTDNSYCAYVEAQAQANERNKGVVFDALAAASITSVKVIFDGCAARAGCAARGWFT